jgi:hypothetical protein
MVLRGLAAAGAVTAVVGAVVMRHWDTQAGKRVADLTRARASDEWRFEERVAELESDLEESRELRAKLEKRLRAKRSELAGLRNEHAALLRRYATAETERASALEGRRLLEIEATVPARALPPAPVPAQAPAPEERPEAAEPAQGLPALSSPEGARLFRRAQAALARFDADRAAAMDAAAKDAVRTADGRAGSPDPGPVPVGADRGAQPEAAREDEAQGKSEAADGQEHAAAASTPPHASGHFTVPTAVAVVPAAAPARRPAVEGGFDFFGAKAKDGGTGALRDAVQNEDLADVVGREALDLHEAETEAEFRRAGEESRGVGQVIDLTAHDETEQIDLQGLRSAAS